MSDHPIGVFSLQVGKPEVYHYQNKKVTSAIVKQPVTEPLFLSQLGLEGDEQADLVNHGGVDKAIHFYPIEHYAFFEKELNITLPQAAFGENVTVRGLLETEICIGDILQFGDAILQVTQGRRPCYKLAMKLGIESLPARFIETGYTGFYMRVLQDGIVSQKSGLFFLERDPRKVTVDFVNQILYHDKKNAQGIHRILEVPRLAEGLRQSFERKVLEL